MHDPTRLLSLRDILVDLKLGFGNWGWAWVKRFVIENAKSFLHFRPQSICLSLSLVSINS